MNKTLKKSIVYSYYNVHLSPLTVGKKAIATKNVVFPLAVALRTTFFLFDCFVVLVFVKDSILRNRPTNEREAPKAQVFAGGKRRAPKAKRFREAQISGAKLLYR